MDRLTSHKLFADPRYIEGKKLLLTALQEYKEKISSIKDAHVEYTHDIDHINELRGNPLYFPYLGSGLGNGLFVELADGSVKYDLISGIGVHFFGHSNLAMASHAIDAALQDTIMQGNLQQN
ncbi:MAG: argD, partial [Chlamydiia bacterium]|nr:argD [Chlamydiia bacterium]